MAGLQNVALYRPTKQSSYMYMDGNGFPFYAVDGNVDTFWNHGSCTHTKLEAGKPYTIFVQNFPKGIAVNVKMLGAGKLDGPVVGSIASFDDDGTSEIAWTPTQGLAKG